jgi:DNA repair exonuclease SbcCD ATPase subunit
MRVIIKSISLLNFKGVRDFKADFDANVTEFRGENGTGKTTLNDAFDWLLYGKDSFGRSDFQIKTLDSNNHVIEKLPHEVSAVLDVDGEEIRLRKCFTEIWKKPRGKAEEEFAGHNVERYWNDVPVKEKEYNEKIAQICNEEVFRLITNPFYFFAQKKEYQRNFLIQLAGSVTDEQLAMLHPEFQKLVEDMSGKTTDEYNREIGAQIKRIKADNEGIPERIDERKRDVPQAEDWSALEAEISAKNAQIETVEKEMHSEIEAYNAAVSKQKEKIQRKADLEVKYSQKKQDLVSAVNRKYYEDKQKQSKLHDDKRYYENSIQTENSMIESNNKQDADLARNRESLLAEWKQIKTRTLTFDDNDRAFVCPTCGRQLEAHDIEAKKAEMTAAFNAETSRLLEANMSKGQSVKSQRDRIAEDTAKRQSMIQQYKSEIQKIESDPLFNAILTQTDASSVVNDADLVKMQTEIDALKAEIEQTIIQPADQTQNKQKIADLQREINELRVRLNNKQIIENNAKRIEELESQFKTQNEEIARLEGVQFQISQFKKCLIEEVESKINALFSFVRFKMYEQQINGGERETCEALVDGVPYSTNVNTAARVNAGIDVINAISKSHEIYAPIFVDNRESVTKLIDSDSQIINLFKDSNYTFLTKI